MTSPDSAQLLPCPFCGSDQVSLSEGETGDGQPWPYVECESCAATAMPDNWNNRQALARGPQQAGGEDAVQAAARIASEAACLRIDNERLQAEVARLREQLVNVREAFDLKDAAFRLARDAANDLQAALREAGRDAERLDWLDQQRNDDVQQESDGERTLIACWWNVGGQHMDVRSAIDAARLVRDGDSGEGES